ncbi:MAG: Asp-tRNA(Asn)/Glu-tRNA(Gln) amidotransferase subunit GatB [Crocinitomicaceae bacterium]|nr:Asp-tRNA(Asn)/Glu-tRNA(Gln) amidotransferase subunit GatB [Crocinitomicaceae bacterium]MDG1658989.1 Asp-tRNA(Asn)/Glu-tRNA(Gln) amidotransferase subunit GatB [Crocinitomicaceae bacterium]
MKAEIRDKYEAVIGLEVHAQMLTKSKAYSNDVNEFGAIPNSNVSAISLGHPGTLPFMNKKTIEFAVKLGIACESDIAPDQYFARKNYFYPDLPKGYQITQDLTPICTNGRIIIKDSDGVEKEIGLTRIHMEEDAGKSMHDMDLYDTLVDINRAGVPLLEIVSEPDLRSSEDAYAYVSEVRKLVRYLDICDGNMEEGSLRCDANISVRLLGAPEFGTKVEVKNMNSMRHVQKAIEFEIERQIIAIENGETISQETRSFDGPNNRTISMRSKEAANDYRFFPEPDLQPISVKQEFIEKVKATMPILPRELFLKYTNELGLSDYDAYNITDSKDIALYYEEIISHTSNYKGAANWLMGGIKSFINLNGTEISDFPISAKSIADLIKIIDDGKISSTVASQKVFPAMLEGQSKSPLQHAESMNLIQESNEESILEFIEKVIKQHPSEIERYTNGEKQLMGFLMGQLMKISRGKADPKAANQLLRQTLDKL